MIPLRDDNPSATLPVVTVTLIVLCALVFLWEISLSEPALHAAILAYGVTPATLFGATELPPDIHRIPPSLTVFTSMFLHGGWMHLIGNMLYLWIYGDNIEDAMGHTRFIVFYLLCGVAAVGAQGALDPTSTVPMIGASGAISGVLGAYLLLYPRARVLVLVPLGFYIRLFHLPAAFVLGLWFVLQLANTLLMQSQEGGGVAFAAHAGGFVAGMALVPLFKRRRVRLFAPARRR
jgi:membrane associated rhomboid family serine protease